MYVQVKSSQLRSEPKYWASSVGSVSYGTKLNVLKEENGWMKVTTSGGTQGYIHQSAVTPRKVVLSSSSKVRSSDSSEIVLAGKGFNREVERQYAADNSSLDFRAVNAMESLKVSDSEVRQFMSSGKLTR